jgi:hypothetical protein
VVDAVNDVFEKEGLGELVEVDIGDLNDSEAVEDRGKIADGDGVFDEVDLVSRDGPCVDGKPGGGEAGAKNEVATANSRRRGVA